MNQQDDFFEVTNEVPFKPIKLIKIESLQAREDDFILRASMTLENQTETEIIELVRTEKNIDWLIETLNNSGQLPLLPRTDYQNTFSHLFSLISGSQPTRTKKIKLLKEKVLLRCLNLIATICLEHFKQIGTQYQMPIFIFFHENFALYQNPIYFKEEKSTFSAKVGNYIWEKYALFTGKGNWEELQNQKKKLVEQRQRLNEVSSKLYDYLTQLNKLQDQFISEKQCIRKRVNITSELHLSFEMQLRYLDLVIEEIKQTAARAEQQRLQNSKIISAYRQQLEAEVKQTYKTNKKLLGQYVKVICVQEDKLRIAPK